MITFSEKYGPWALVSGASEGTGRSFALNLAQQGVNLILLARREAPLQAVADEVKSYGVDCITGSVDLYDATAFDKIRALVGDRELGLYIANAGADPNGSLFLELDVDTWLKHINRGIVTTMKCCHHFGGLMVERGHGGLLIVGSGACYGGANFLTTYSATKAFEMCFSEGLWSELKPHGVDVLYHVMVSTDTPSFRKLLDKTGQPVPQNLADPDEVAKKGLEMLPNGPIYNWGLEDDEAGYAISSAQSRRDRALAVSEAAKSTFGDR